jgi:hypothetical protein
MIYEILAIVGGASTIGLLVAFLWQRAATARAQKAAVEQEQFASSLKAALAETQKARTQDGQRYEDLTKFYEKELKEARDALDACSHDPAAVRLILRDLFSVPSPTTDSGRSRSGPVSSQGAPK